MTILLSQVKFTTSPYPAPDETVFTECLGGDLFEMLIIPLFGLAQKLSKDV